MSLEAILVPMKHFYRDVPNPIELREHANQGDTDPGPNAETSTVENVPAPLTGECSGGRA